MSQDKQFKVCSKCNECKSEDDFETRKDSQDGRRNHCRACRASDQKRTTRRKIRQTEYYLENKDKLSAQYQDWAMSNPEKMRAIRRRANLKRLYGLSEDDYLQLATNQGFNCKICNLPSSNGKPLFVDHCHSTGKVRGLLCSLCNSAIGKLKDSPEICMNAASYLMAAKEK